MTQQVAKARVWNRHVKDHVEEFRGEKLVIPAGKFILMNHTDAIQFRGQYTPIIRNGLGDDLYPKKIEVELISDGQVAEAPKTFSCMSCSKEGFLTQEALDLHIAAEHLDEMVDKDAREKLEKRASKRG